MKLECVTTVPETGQVYLSVADPGVGARVPWPPPLQEKGPNSWAKTLIFTRDYVYASLIDGLPVTGIPVISRTVLTENTIPHNISIHINFSGLFQHQSLFY